MRYILTLITLFFSTHVCAAYDVEKVKERIANSSSFAVSGWELSSKKQKWRASTSLKSASIVIGEKKAELTLPFINPPQKKSAIKRCNEFAALTLAINNEKELGIIKDVIRKSTTRHQIKFFRFSDMIFYVVPKLVGMRVSLHCTVKIK